MCFTYEVGGSDWKNVLLFPYRNREVAKMNPNLKGDYFISVPGKLFDQFLIISSCTLLKSRK